MADFDDCGMVTKREASRRARRDAILGVARRHFHDHGYGATSMSAIACEMGGSKGTLWAHFASKEELFAAAVSGLIAEYAPFIALDAGEPLTPALTRYARHFLEIMLSPEVIALNRLVIAEAPRFPELGRIFWEEGPRRRYRTLSTFLDAKMRQGELRTCDALTLSAQFHHLCYYRLVMQNLWGVLLDTTDEAIREDAAATVELFLHGCLPKAAAA